LVQVSYQYDIDNLQISVSGISSGGYMATQYHVAHSIDIMGVGIIAGGPFYCAENSLNNALTRCMYGFLMDVNKFINIAKDWGKRGSIDDTSNMNSTRVYLYSGTLDTTVYPAVVKGAETFYQAFTTASNIKTQYSIQSNHAQPTLDYGNACAYKGSPYISKCNYDGAGETLTWIYKTLNPRGTANRNNLVTIDQTKYIPAGYTTTSMSVGRTAYAYVPTACKSGSKCKVHVAFHGCLQTIADIQDKYYFYGGYNEWAESNDIIVLYPQAAKSSFFPTNPNGCWDWWGYVNAAYSDKSGPQIRMVNSMIADLYNM